MKVNWDEILEQIDYKVEPKKMDKRQALENLEELMSSIEARIDCLNDEIEAQDEIET